jgi:hypothetical protein
MAGHLVIGGSNDLRRCPLYKPGAEGLKAAANNVPLEVKSPAPRGPAFYCGGPQELPPQSSRCQRKASKRGW